MSSFCDENTPPHGQDKKSLAARANKFLSREAVEFAGEVETQDYLVKFIATFINKFKEPIDAVSPVPAQEMLNNMGALYRTLLSMQQGEGDEKAHLETLNNTLAVFQQAHDAISKLQFEDESLTADQTGILAGLKKTQKNLHDAFGDLLQSQEHPRLIVASDGRVIDPDWATKVGQQKEEEKEPQAESFAALAARYLDENVPGLTRGGVPIKAEVFLKEDLLAALAACYSKIETWENEATLPPGMPDKEQANAVGIELQQFNQAMASAATGYAMPVTRIFIGNLPSILENSALLVGQVLEEAKRRGEGDTFQYETLLQALEPINAHFQQHFGAYLCDDGIAASRA